MTVTVYAAHLRRALARPRVLVRDLLLVLAFASFTALAARIALPLPFTPVPITGQTLAVLLSGVLLGSRRGALAQLAYLAQGAAGLPVFAGGRAGLGVLLGPTGGYLVGFVLAAGLVGWLAERGWRRHTRRLFVALLLGNLVIYLCGALWLARFVPDPLGQGVLPFIPGDLVKIAIAAGVVPSGSRLITHLLQRAETDA
jgi:biotin transport system substrate-specific component